jgi:hypothetical protein
MYATSSTSTAGFVSSELRDGSCECANRRTDALITVAVRGRSVTAIDRSRRKAHVEPAETSLTAGGQRVHIIPHRIGLRSGHQGGPVGLHTRQAARHPGSDLDHLAAQADRCRTSEAAGHGCRDHQGLGRCANRVRRTTPPQSMMPKTQLQDHHLTMILIYPEPVHTVRPGSRQYEMKTPAWKCRVSSFPTRGST